MNQPLTEGQITAGQLVWLDSGFTCHEGGPAKVRKDEHGFYVDCDEGRHYLDGQLDETGHYVGVYAMPDISMLVLYEILRERHRQIDKGFDPEHDDEHDDGEIARAAACYAVDVPIYEANPRDVTYIAFRELWPWRPEEDARFEEDERGDLSIFRNQNLIEVRRRFLVKAAALLIAEIERLDRRAAKGEVHA